MVPSAPRVRFDSSGGSGSLGRCSTTLAACGSMGLAMATDVTTLDAALLERDRVLRILREHEVEIRARGVTRLRMFGSMARGEAAPESDVDLIADIDRSTRFSLLDLVGLQYLLRDLLGREVDVGTTVERMRPRMRQRFEADALEVF
jgi:predicted nucleotidyltransferase